ncbi:MAG: hypothetical protein ACRCYX_15250 [Dermatophilaceae bacterium]
MSNVIDTLKFAMDIDGALGVALVEYSSGMTLGTRGGGPELDLEIAAAANTEVVRAKLRAAERLGLSDSIEDILITLTSQYHLIRMISGKDGEGLFLYLALNRNQANLALARRQLSGLERDLVI